MFSAVDRKGTIQTVHGKTDEQIRMFKNQSFYCPVCKQPLQLKAGLVNQPHFAHIHLNTCPTFWEPESDEHIEGKLLLKDLFSKMNWDTRLEVYLPEISQQPDLLLNKNNKQVAVEYQCSAINIQRFRQRVKGYQSIDMEQRWVFGPKLTQRISSTQIKLSETAFISLLKNNQKFEGWSLYPGNMILVLDHSILPFSPRKIFALQDTFSIPEYPLSITQSNISVLINEWKKTRIHWLLAPNISKAPKDRSYYRFMYNQRIHRSTLPAFIGIPLFSLPYIKTSAPVWQTYVFYDSFSLLQKQSKFTIKQMESLFQKRIHGGNIQLRNFLFLSPNYQIPLHDYLHFLIRINVFKKDGNDIVVGPELGKLSHVKTTDQSIHAIHQFYRKYEMFFLS
ncbi:competence protein CoiA [Bacillus carboniphilus]|uniref:competence protein CoiA n=1 Tax=Bacillus carboniphilus TaxID=86663 RepID=UPI0031D0D2B6